MDPKAFFKLSYGLYIISTENEANRQLYRQYIQSGDQLAGAGQRDVEQK